MGQNYERKFSYGFACSFDKGNFPYATCVIAASCVVVRACHVVYANRMAFQLNEGIANGTFSVNGTEANLIITNKVLGESELIYSDPLVYQFNQVWRFITYSLVHKDLSHLLTNLAIIVFSLPILESIHGSFRPTLVYLVGVFLRSLTFGQLSYGYLAGASGGCYALVFCNFSDFIMNYREMENVKLAGGRAFLMVPMGGALIFDVIKLIIEYYGSVTNGDETNSIQNTQGVSYLTHIAGAVAGLLSGIILVRNFKVERYELIVLGAAWTILVGVFIVLIVLTVIRWYS